MTTAIYWFRNDLRLRDNLAFTQACNDTQFLLPIYINHTDLGGMDRPTYPQISKHRIEFLQESIQDLRDQLIVLGSNLFELTGDVLEVFQNLRDQLSTNIIYCEQIEVTQELDLVARLRKAGFEIKSIWQSSMIDPRSLPFDLEDMPSVFTQFRLKVEKHKLKFTPPLVSPLSVSPLPNKTGFLNKLTNFLTARSEKSFYGGERKALAHMDHYFERRLADTYKKTRNGLIGMDYSSKFSPWLALGCCSARTIAQKLTQYEHQFGSNEGTYWLWFELLWRDYFRFLNFENSNEHYSEKYSGEEEREEESEELSHHFQGIKFRRWSTGYTGESFVDAGMRELSSTGYLSNRMRQVVASYWIYNLQGNWKVGAAWFRSQLLDYDVYSNQGNWQYIAGKGPDHQGGRQFNIAKQTQDHDPNGVYTKIWLT